MATVDDLLTELYRRTRDPSRSATPENLGIQLLSLAQQVVNIGTKSQLQTLPFTLTQSRLLYQISVEIPDCARLEAIRLDTQDLTEVPWRDLWCIDHLWFRKIVPSLGAQRGHWAKIGRDLFAVYPGPTVDTDVHLIYTPILGTLVSLTDPITIRNEFFPLLLDLTEAMFLFRLRMFGTTGGIIAPAETGPFETVIQRLQSMIGLKA